MKAILDDYSNISEEELNKRIEKYNSTSFLHQTIANLKIKYSDGVKSISESAKKKEAKVAPNEILDKISSSDT